MSIESWGTDIGSSGATSSSVTSGIKITWFNEDLIYKTSLDCHTT